MRNLGCGHDRESTPGRPKNQTPGAGPGPEGGPKGRDRALYSFRRGSVLSVQDPSVLSAGGPSRLCAPLGGNAAVVTWRPNGFPGFRPDGAGRQPRGRCRRFSEHAARAADVSCVSSQSKADREWAIAIRSPEPIWSSSASATSAHASRDESSESGSWRYSTCSPSRRSCSVNHHCQWFTGRRFGQPWRTKEAQAHAPSPTHLFPVSTGRCEACPYCDQPPTNKRPWPMPRCSITRRLWHAVTPEPQ